MLNGAGSNVGVEDGVVLFRKDWVQPVRVRLDRMCSCEIFNSERFQGTFSVIQFGHGEDIYKDVDSGGTPNL